MECDFAVNADETHWAAVNEKTSNCRTSFWQVMEVEKKSSSVATTIQVEVAETMETFRMDSTQ
jgi:hypothetical protein